jgi:hypothetical protein
VVSWDRPSWLLCLGSLLLLGAVEWLESRPTTVGSRANEVADTWLVHPVATLEVVLSADSSVSDAARVEWRRADETFWRELAMKDGRAEMAMSEFGRFEVRAVFGEIRSWSEIEIVAARAYALTLELPGRGRWDTFPRGPWAGGFWWTDIASFGVGGPLWRWADDADEWIPFWRTEVGAERAPRGFIAIPEAGGVHAAQYHELLDWPVADGHDVWMPVDNPGLMALDGGLAAAAASVLLPGVGYDLAGRRVGWSTARPFARCAVSDLSAKKAIGVFISGLRREVVLPPEAGSEGLLVCVERGRDGLIEAIGSSWGRGRFSELARPDGFPHGDVTYLGWLGGARNTGCSFEYLPTDAASGRPFANWIKAPQGWMAWQGSRGAAFVVRRTGLGDDCICGERVAACEEVMPSVQRVEAGLVLSGPVRIRVPERRGSWSVLETSGRVVARREVSGVSGAGELQMFDIKVGRYLLRSSGGFEGEFEIL